MAAVQGIGCISLGAVDELLGESSFRERLRAVRVEDVDRDVQAGGWRDRRCEESRSVDRGRRPGSGLDAAPR